MKNVILAKTAGFCFGVRRAVDMAYGIAGRDKVYTYGPIIHNETVVEDLEAKGVKVVHSIEEAAALAGGTMIIRSHGVSKEEIDLLKQMGFDIVDATCPFVKKIHHIVEKYSEQGYGIIIIGSADHPEVQAISGWCKEPPVIIESEEEAREIAGRVDAMIVIGGRQSSNTQKLYDICKNECKNTYYIQTLVDLDLKTFESIGNVGITAGASTPNNIIEEVHTNM